MDSLHYRKGAIDAYTRIRILPSGVSHRLEEKRPVQHRVTGAVCIALVGVALWASTTYAAQVCDITFGASAPQKIAALNLDVDYAFAAGEFVGRSQNVDCVDLSGADMFAINDHDAERVLKGGWIKQSGMATAVTLMRCRFTTPGAIPRKSDFALTVVDASDISFNPLSVTPSIKSLSCSDTTAGACGDVSGDGSITASDALLAMRRGVGLNATFNCVSDCSGSTSTTTTTLEPALFTLQINKNGSGLGSVTSNPPGINCGTDCSQAYTDGTRVTLSGVAATGAHFVGWSGDVPAGCQGTTADCTVTMRQHRTVTATFESVTVRNRIRYLNNLVCGGSYFTSTLVVTPASMSWTSYSGVNSAYQDWNNPTIGSSWTATLGNCGQAYFYGETALPAGKRIQIVLTEEYGSAILGFYDEGSLLQAGEVKAEPYLRLYAPLAQGMAKVSFDASAIETDDWCGDVNGDGTISATDALMLLQRGVGLNPTFNCYDPCQGTSTTTTTLPGPFYDIQVERLGTGTGRVTSSPAGINCGADCTESFASGTDITLSALPSSGSLFGGWSGNVPSRCIGSTAPCTLTMNRNRLVGATFTNAITTTTTTTTLPPRMHRLDVVKLGTGSGRVTSVPAGIDCGADCNQTYNEGTQVILTAVASSGSRFTGWSKSVPASCVGNTAPCTVTMTQARTVNATFDTAGARNKLRYLNNLVCGGSYFTSTLSVTPANMSWSSYSGTYSAYKDWSQSSIGSSWKATLGNCGTAYFSGYVDLPAGHKILFELTEEYGEALLKIWDEGSMLVAGERVRAPAVSLRADRIEGGETRLEAR